MAATGGSARHSLVLDYALRPLFSYLKATLVSTGVFAATADFGSDEAGRSLADRIHRAAAELVGLLEPVGPVDLGANDARIGPGPAKPAPVAGPSPIRPTPFARGSSPLAELARCRGCPRSAGRFVEDPDEAGSDALVAAR